MPQPKSSREQIEYIRGNLGLLKKHDCLKGFLVLDVGCATGESITVFSEEGSKAVGVDINPELLYIAKKNNPSRILVVCDAHEMPFKSGVFDLVTCFATLYSLDNERALAEISKVTRKDGYVFLTLHHIDFYISMIVGSLKNLNFYWLRLLWPLFNGMVFNLVGRQLCAGNCDVFYTYRRAKKLMGRYNMKIVNKETVKGRFLPYFMRVLIRRI